MRKVIPIENFMTPRSGGCSSTRSYSENALVSLKVFSRSRHISDKLKIYVVMINKKGSTKIVKYLALDVVFEWNCEIML